MSESQPQRVKLLNDKLIGSFVAASIKFLELITRPRIEFTERPLLRERRNLLSRLRSRSIQSKRKSYRPHRLDSSYSFFPKILELDDEGRARIHDARRVGNASEAQPCTISSLINKQGGERSSAVSVDATSQPESASPPPSPTRLRLLPSLSSFRLSACLLEERSLLLR